MKKSLHILKLLIITVFASLLSFSLQAQNKRTYKSFSFSGNHLVINTNDGEIHIKPYTEKTIKVSYTKAQAVLMDTSNSVISKPLSIITNLIDEENYIQFSTGAVKVIVNKKPFKISFVSDKDTLLSEENGFFVRDSERGVRFSLQTDESIYGAGFRALPLNRRGYRLKLENEPHYGYQFGEQNLNYSIPMVVSSNKYAILFDNPQNGYVDIGKQDSKVLEFGAIGGGLTYYVMFDKNYEGIMQQYTLLTGRQPLPPRWALGNLQSRMAYANQTEVLDIVNKMQTAGYPLDAIIIDLQWFGKGTHNSFNMGNFSWDAENWKNPKQMIADLKAKGVKTVLVTEPFILKESKNFNYVYNNNLLATDSLGKPFVMNPYLDSLGKKFDDKGFWFGAGGLLDIFKPAAQKWMWQQYKNQIDIGVAGWWGDLGEPEKHPLGMRHVAGKANQVHNIYGHYWDKMLYEQYAKDYPTTRLFNLNRSGFAGSQRFAVYPWSGDVSRTWEGFKPQIPIMLGMSICGMAYMHSDLGGFTPADRDEELYTRWLQYGVFNPVFRPHGDSKIPPEPIFYSEKTQTIIKKFVALRYQLMPYNYTLAWENTTTGTPLARPLFFEDAENKEIKNIDDTYFWGKAFLVAPIIEKKQKERKVYLPKGNWFDFWNDEQFAGNQWITKKTEIETIPVFVRGGSIIPMVSTFKSTDNYPLSELIIHYYYDPAVPSSSYTLYEDDGLTKGANENGQYQLTTIETDASQPDLIIMSINKQGTGYKNMLRERTVTVIVHNIKAVPVRIESSTTVKSEWLKKENNEKITIKWNNEDFKFSIKLK